MFIKYHGQQDRDTHTYTIADTPEGADARPNKWFSRRLKLKLQVGCIYEITAEVKDGSIHYTPNSERYVSTADDAAQLKLAHDAKVAQLAAERQGAPDWRDTLATARAAYKGARGAQRSIILAQIIAEVTR